MLKKGKALKKIKATILEVAEKHGIKVDRIILFGSRARGEAKKESDYDILIIVKDMIDRKLKYILVSEILRKLADAMLYADIIIKNKAEFEENKKYRGFVDYWAEKEGIII